VEENQPYKKLLTYKYCFLVYHLTMKFTEIFLSSYKDRRTREQMDQAARSGKQNVAEGASQQTSFRGYIKLVGVARGSLEELLEDFKDFAIRNNVDLWDWGDDRYKKFRRYRIYIKHDFENPTPSTPPIPMIPNDKELAANIMIDLVTRTGYLLDKQRKGLENKLIKEGGFSENLYKRRRAFRGY